MSSTTTTSGLLASIPHPAVPLGFGPNNAVNPQWYIYWQQLASLANNITNTSTTVVSGSGGLSTVTGNGQITTVASTLSVSGDVTLSLLANGAEAGLYFQPLDVSGYDLAGDYLDIVPVHYMDFEGNAFLTGPGLDVSILGLVNTAPTPTDVIPQLQAGGEWLYFEFNVADW